MFWRICAQKTWGVLTAKATSGIIKLPMKTARKGFTLIELLIVISIVGILSFVGVSSFIAAQRATRDARRKADLREVKIALEQYYAENLSYPVANWWGESSAAGSHTTDYIPGLVPNYIQKLPNDVHVNRTRLPCNNGPQTGYMYRSDGTDYKLVANCTPEGTLGNVDDTFYDPVRPTYSWQVSTPGGQAW